MAEDLARVMTTGETTTTDPRDDLLSAFGNDPTALLARVVEDPSRFPVGSIQLLERLVAGRSVRSLSPAERGLLAEIAVEAERPVPSRAEAKTAPAPTHSTPSAPSPTAAPRSPTAPSAPADHPLPTAAFWWLSGGGDGGEEKEPSRARTPRARSSSPRSRPVRRRR